ncbi:MAG: hypothetical protein IKZ82_03205 [Clostridia bacterium]|nr:hypothetical protein [Clostridia bacterium]
MEDNYESKAWNNFLSIRESDPNCRDASFEHCRSFFIKDRSEPKKRDEIALHLFAYLASWGMLRNPFMMQKDYLFHRKVVDILCEDKYNKLLIWEPLYSKENDSMIALIDNLKERIVETYKKETYYKDSEKEPKPHIIKNVTDTLASKIILGTFGCVPAYDENLVRGLKGIAPRKFDADSLKAVIDYAQENKTYIEKCKETLKRSIPDACDLYTTMKIVDILLFGKGVHIK